ncbi:MAG: hypothetical protein AUJ82_08045 [Verrucomicrobia bacterium CG1_02_43_26]|nr:MAG: hypothetical protein AUJ82_08045 [Verrucomicrobia bacterium CG1_02_43_26]
MKQGTESPVITFVCTGNICRSPIAEGLLLDALGKEEEPLRSIRVISAGTSAMDGQRASQHSITALNELGVKLDHFRSQYLTQEIIDQSWAIFCMTEAHRDYIRNYFNLKDQHLFLMTDLMEGKTSHAGIPDPIGQDLSAYIICRDTMLAAIPSIIQFLKQQLIPQLDQT